MIQLGTLSKVTVALVASNVVTAREFLNSKITQNECLHFSFPWLLALGIIQIPTVTFLKKYVLILD